MKKRIAMTSSYRFRLLQHLLFGLWLAQLLMLSARAKQSQPPAPLTIPAEVRIDENQVLKMATELTRKHYPDADNVLIDDRILVRYEADGTYIQWDHWYTKILTLKGAEEEKVLSLPFTIPYSQPEDVKVPILEVLRDGQRLKVDVSSQGRIMTDESQMAENIYNPNQKVLRITLPDLKEGDVIHYLVYYRVRHPRVRNIWADIQLFESTMPVVHYEYMVDAPKTRPLKKIVLRSPIDDTVKAEKVIERNGRLFYKWTARHVPRMFPEPAMPSLSQVVQRLLVSTAPDWQTISRWYWSISQPHYQVDDAIRAKVRELVTGKKTDMEKIRAIFAFVSQKVRYLGITKEDTAPGYEPHDVTDTFHHLAGVCRDKAALLVAMLREAGFKAWPVLIHTGDPRDPDVPLPWFNHAISCVETQPGKYLLMDSTDENTRQLLPAYLSGKSYLVAKPEGETLLTSPLIPPEKNLMQIESNAQLEADGSLKIESTLLFKGINDNGYRSWFARLKPVERRQFFELVVKRVLPGARLLDCTILPQNIRDLSSMLTVKLRYEAANILTGRGSTKMLALPWIGRRVGYVSFLLRAASLKKRKYPFKTGLTCGVHERIQLNLGNYPAKVEALPESIRLEDAGFSWRNSVTSKKQSLQAENEFLLKKILYQPDEYLSLKRLLAAMDQHFRKRIILEADKEQGSKKLAQKPLDLKNADYLVLYDHRDIRFSTTRKMTEIRKLAMKVLTYAGLKEISEFRLHYLPPRETVQFISGSTITPDGQSHAVKPEDIQIMDASWVGDAPRYPAGKIMVITFPGVKPGCEIRLAYRRSRNDEIYYCDRIPFQEQNPVRKRSVQIRVPHQLVSSFQTELSGNEQGLISVSKNDEGASLLYRWEASEIPAIAAERQLPPLWTFVPTLHWQLGKQEAWAENLLRAMDERAQLTPILQRKVSQIISGKTTLSGKLVAIRDAVSRLRRTGPPFYLLSPKNLTPAEKTLQEGYGHSADLAILLKAMLSAVGVKSRFVLPLAYPPVPRLKAVLQTLPLPEDYATVLVQPEQPDPYFWLNDTDEYSFPGTTRYEGRWAMDLKTPDLLTRIMVRPQCVSRICSHWQIAIEEKGDAELSRQTRRFGAFFNSRARFVRRLTPQRVLQEQQKIVSSISQAAQLIDKWHTNYSAYPGEESIRVRWPRFAVLSGNYLYFQIPNPLRNLLTLWTQQRKNPFYSSQTLFLQNRFSIKLPSAYRQLKAAPTGGLWIGPGNIGYVRVNIRSRLKHTGSIVVESDVQLNPAIVSPEHYGRLVELVRWLSHPEMNTFILGRQ